MVSNGNEAWVRCLELPGSQDSLEPSRLAARSISRVFYEKRSGGVMKILLAVDDSKFSEAAVQTVTKCQPQGTEIRVLHAVDLALPIPTT
jgi:hypothetical protein